MKEAVTMFLGFAKKSANITVQQRTDIAPSEPQGITPSEPQNITPSEPQDITPSEPQGITPSDPQGIAPSEPQDIAPSDPQGIALSPRRKHQADMRNETIRETESGEILKPADFATQESMAADISPAVRKTRSSQAMTQAADKPVNQPKPNSIAKQKKRAARFSTPPDSGDEEQTEQSSVGTSEPTYEIDEIFGEDLMLDDESGKEIPHVLVKWASESNPEWIPADRLDGNKLLQEYRDRENVLGARSSSMEEEHDKTMPYLYRIGDIQPTLLGMHLASAQYMTLDIAKIRYLQQLGLPLAAKKVNGNSPYKAFLISLFRQPNTAGIRVILSPILQSPAYLNI